MSQTASVSLDVVQGLPPMTVLDEGDSLQIDGQLFANPAVFTIETGWGDGTSTIITIGPSDLTYTVIHPYLDDNPTGTPADDYIVTTSVVRTSDGRSLFDYQIATVNDVAPTITKLTLNPGSLVLGDTTVLNCEFTDPGVADTFLANVDWGDRSDPDGDGNVGQKVVLGQLRQFMVNHVYTRLGNYRVTVQVEDDDRLRVQAVAQIRPGPQTLGPTVIPGNSQYNFRVPLQPIDTALVTNVVWKTDTPAVGTWIASYRYFLKGQNTITAISGEFSFTNAPQRLKIWAEYTIATAQGPQNLKSIPITVDVVQLHVNPPPPARLLSTNGLCY